MVGGRPPAADLASPQGRAFLSNQRETSMPGLGTLFILGIWSCFLIYLYLNRDEMECVLPT